MMIWSHLISGVLLGVLTGNPVVAIVASVFPDVDLFIGEHRRTFHLPVVSLLIGLGGFGLGLEIVGTFWIGVSIHCVMDLASDGINPLTDDTRSVYSHVNRSWISGREIIQTGGSTDLYFSFMGGILCLLFGVEISIIVALLALGCVNFTVSTWARRRANSEHETVIDFLLSLGQS